MLRNTVGIYGCCDRIDETSYRYELIEHFSGFANQESYKLYNFLDLNALWMGA